MIICLILGIISILYGICIMRVASGTLFFGVWYAIGVFFILLGILIHSHKLALIPRTVKILFGALIAAGIIVMCVCCVLVSSHFHDKGNKNLDCIIVLGAQVKLPSPSEASASYSDSNRAAIPSTVLKYRLDTAADYLRANPGTLCIVSGGDSSSEPEAEAVVMKRYLIEKGIDADRIITEDQSTSTKENIEFSRQLLSKQDISPDNCSIGIVTNNFHIFRAVKIAEKAGFENACGIAAPSNTFYLPNNVLRECMGIVKDLVKGNM